MDIVQAIPGRPPLSIVRRGLDLHVALGSDHGVIDAHNVHDLRSITERLTRWHRVGRPHDGAPWTSLEALHRHADDELEAARHHQRRRRSAAAYRIRGAL